MALLQLDPLSFAATLSAPYLPRLVDYFKSKLGFSSIDDAKLHTLSWTIVNIEQLLDELEYEQLLNSSTLAKIRRLRYALYKAEDELDEYYIACSHESGQPTQSVYNQVFSSSSLSETITQENLGMRISNSMIDEMPSSSDPTRSSLSFISPADIQKFAALWPRYRQLPPPLKKCFVFFSIFPKNYKFQKENLVQLWLAEDFVRDDGEYRKLEDVGNSYFDKLIQESFFSQEDVSQIDFDLHDLAKFVSCGECLTINEGEAITDFINRLTDSLRHFSLHCANYLPETAKFLAGCKGLRTFFLHVGGKRRINKEVKVPYNQLICFKSLRVLDMSCVSIIEVPDSIGCLNHLRYLDLSNSKIEKLPKTIRKLHSLQILKLIGCKNLNDLPCLEHLRSLKHLFVDHLVSLPPGIGQLSILETFSCPFVVGEKRGENIGVLKNMINLRGSLCISKLENVLNSEEAKEAALDDKEFLRQLKLKWSDEEPIGQYRFEQVLEGLQPHRNLETLKISGYGGQIFPDWVTNESFENLKKVSVIKCKECRHLPPLWRLPKLESLIISGMDQIKQLNDDFFFHIGSGDGFKSLEVLEVKNMSELKSWVTILGGDIDRLPFPKLNQLTFKICPLLEQLNVLQMLNSLTFLKIKECPLLIGWMDQQPGWRKEEQEDASLIYQRI